MILQSRKTQIFILIFLIICMGLSFFYHFHNNEIEFTKLIAPINVNIELEKEYVNDIVLIANPYNEIINLTSTSFSANTLNKIIVHTEITKCIIGLTVRIFVNENDSISFIDNISIFIGNKLFYFNSFDISEWEGIKSNDYTDYNIPLEMYKKSLIKPWINWYGDFNYILQIIMEIITQPHKYLFVYFIGLIILLLFYRNLYSLVNKYSRLFEIILLLALLVFGFLIRINTITRYSAWVDELFSAVTVSNPNRSIVNIFKDAGNPPFYYFLLRTWFSVFGWTETAGRLLSSILGTMGIISLYWFVKYICGKKYAFISAFLLTISYTSVGYSNEIRPYILLITLGPLVSLYLLKLLEKADFKNGLFYTILGILLVNTHYYGVLFIIGNFLFYFIHKRYTFERLIVYFLSGKYSTEKKEIIKFFLVNVLITISFIPYFFITFLPNALLNNNFNSWIPKPGKNDYFLFIILFFLYIIVRILLFILKKNNLYSRRKILLFHYSFFSIIYIYFSALIISLYRPILTFRYLSICIPLITIILTFIIFVFFEIASKFIISPRFSVMLGGKGILIVSFLFFVILSNFISNLRIFGGGESDVIRESIDYIANDSNNYSFAAQLKTSWYWDDDINKFYAFAPLPLFDYANSNYVLYLPVFNTLTDEAVYQELENKNISFDKINKICLSKNRYLLKILPYEYTYIAQVPMPTDISNNLLYNLHSLNILDDNLVLNCDVNGVIGPYIYFPLQEPITMHLGVPFVEIECTNSKSGILKVYFDFGNDLSEENKAYMDIAEMSEMTKIRLPITCWPTGTSLYLIRVDPPNGTVFEIKSIKFGEN